MDRFDRVIAGLDAWQFPIALAFTLGFCITYAVMVRITKDSQVWPKQIRTSSFMRFLNRLYCLLYMIQGQVWPFTWAMYFAILLIKDFFNNLYYVMIFFGRMLRKKGPQLGKKLLERAAEGITGPESGTVVPQ